MYGGPRSSLRQRCRVLMLTFHRCASSVSVKAGSVCMAFPFVVRAGHYGDKREESQVAAPRFPGSRGNCECQSASLNLQSWVCAVARNPSPESREGLKASDRG